MIDRSRMREGDVVLGLASSGIHSNGYSLVRKVFDVEHTNLMQYYNELGMTLGEALLTPTKLYVKSVFAAMEVSDIHGISHITGGGFYENIPRVIPTGLCANIEKSVVPVQPIFRLLQEKGNIPERDMFNTYNMGIGMTLIVPKGTTDAAISALRAYGENVTVLGEIIRSSEEKVKLC